MLRLKSWTSIRRENATLRAANAALHGANDTLRAENDVLRAATAAVPASLSDLCVLPDTPTNNDRVAAIGRLLRVRSIPGVRKVRVGRATDGGYVCLDAFDGTVAAVSIGIGGDVSWDAAVADRGIPVHQYDHTVDGPPAQHPGFVFHRSKLSTRDRDGETTLAEILNANGLATPGSVVGKIDIEGDEWEVLGAAPASVLAVFSQIVVEFHWLERLVIDAFYAQAIAALGRLAEAFVPVHVHGNNFAPLLAVGNHLIPSVLEVTYVSRTAHTFADSLDVFPTALDAPNNPALPDHRLGYFRF